MRENLLSFLARNLMLTAVTLENEVLKAFFMLPATWSSKSRMVTASHPVFKIPPRGDRAKCCSSEKWTCNMIKQDPCFIKRRRDVGEIYKADNPT